MKTFKHYLTELSFTKSDIPNKFYAIIIIKYNRNDVIDELHNMELKGISGISQSGEIVYDFLGVGRDSMLIMDGPKVVKLNKLSKFMYDNPHYFFSKNMKYLKRIFMKRENDNEGTWHNLGDYVFKVLSDKGFLSRYDLQSNAPGQEISYTKVIKKSKVNSISDAVKLFKKAMLEVLKGYHKDYYYYFEEIIKMSNKNLSDVFITAFNNISSIYASEGEWEVKDNKLKIPPKSYLYVLINFSEKEIIDYNEGNWDAYQKLRNEENVKEEIHLRNRLNKLKSKYIVKFVNTAQWEKIRMIHFDKKYKS